MPKAILFDLDGTLVDTLADVTAIMNSILKDRGFPLRTSEEMRLFMGWGAREMARLSLPEEAQTDETIRTVDVALRAKYAASNNALSHAYPGVRELLQGLTKLGISVAVLSNKPDKLARVVVRKFFPDVSFALIRGNFEGVPCKPDPTAALAIAQEIGVKPAECFFVGDSDVDMQTGINAGMKPIGVSWGYRSVDQLRTAGAEHILKTAADLLPLLG
jgi:phosphoglycolate phosphatase